MGENRKIPKATIKIQVKDDELAYSFRESKCNIPSFKDGRYSINAGIGSSELTVQIIGIIRIPVVNLHQR